jgi:hypothetical protein
MEGDPEDGGRIGVRHSIAVVLAFGLASSGAAEAQGLLIEKTPATAEQIAAAKAEGDRLIAAGHGEGVFVNETTGVIVQVRHPQSGLVCQFIPGAPRNAVTVYSGGDVPRGDDVGCGHNLNQVVMTTFVTRYPKPKTVAEVLRESMADIPRNMSDLARFTGNSVNVEAQPAPAIPPKDRTVIRLTATFQGRPVFTRTAAAQCGAWIVAQRVTAPVDAALAADIAAETDLNASTASVCNARP